MPLSLHGHSHLVDVSYSSSNCNLELYKPTPAPLEWMLDSGAALELVSRCYVTSSAIMEHPCSRSVQLQTAAGPLTVDTVAPMIVQELSLPIQPLVLDDSPARAVPETLWRHPE